MPGASRRTVLATLGAAVMHPVTAAHAQARKLKLILNTGLSGPVAFFLLAEEKGYLREAGLDIAFSGGGGAAVVVPEIQPGRFDVGYGDISALIELIARQPADKGPVAIYTTFNTVPFTIAVDAKGPIRTAKDLATKRISGHPIDAALITFDLFADAAGIDAAKVTVIKSPDGMGNQVADMLAGRGIDGVFGFVNTIIASVTPLGIRPEQLRFINYADQLPEMYGNALIVTRDLYDRDKPALTGMVRAFNRALADTARDPDAAIDALLRRSPADRAVNRTRLVGTLKSEMAHPEGARIGIGDMDDDRLRRLIERIVRVKRLPRTPSLREVFDRSFLPPDGERIRSLAAR